MKMFVIKLSTENIRFVGKDVETEDDINKLKTISYVAELKFIKHSIEFNLEIPLYSYINYITANHNKVETLCCVISR